MKKEAAILVLNYNGKHFLKDCLNSVFKQNGVSFDVFLIDNASSDGSVDFVKKNFPNVLLIENKKNLNFTGGYNVAFNQTMNEYKYLVLLNNDTIVYEDWLKELVRTAAGNEKIGAVTSAIVDKEGILTDGAGGYFVNLLTGTNAGCFSRKKITEIPKVPYPVFYGSGCSLLIKSNVLEKVGLFDENFLAYYEEIDLCWRMHLLGYQVFCNPKSYLFHIGSGSWGHSPKSSFLAERNRILTYFKNLSWANFLAVFPFLIFSRVLFSFLFFQSSKHLLAKLKGIATAVLQFFAYHPKRKKVQNLRTLSDKEVFSYNPTPIFSLRELFRYLK